MSRGVGRLDRANVGSAERDTRSDASALCHFEWLCHFERGEKSRSEWLEISPCGRDDRPSVGHRNPGGAFGIPGWLSVKRVRLRQHRKRWILRLRLTAPHRLTAGGPVMSTGPVISTGLVILSKGRNLVLGGLKSLPSVEMTGCSDGPFTLMLVDGSGAQSARACLSRPKRVS